MARPSATPNARIPNPGLFGSTPVRLVVGIILVVLVAGAAYGAWYLFLRPAGPAPVSLAALPAASAPAPSAPAAAAASEAASVPSAAPSASTSTATGGTLDGTWKVNTSIGSGASGSFVGYRVQETLAGIGANTAVGRTSAVNGSFTLQGTTITAARISADLTALHSDDARRDGQLTHRGLETSTYPSATFVLSRPIALGSLPPSGQIVTVSATGTLTLHGHSHTVPITLQARRTGAVIAVTGSLPIVFADYGITAPTSFIALSVQDHGTMELQLMFTHA